MALKERTIEIDYLPEEGPVELLKYEDEQDPVLRNAGKIVERQNGRWMYYQKTALENYDSNKSYIYTPQNKEGRIISYSYALSVLYSNLTRLAPKIKLKESDTDWTKEQKENEREFIASAIKIIQGNFSEILKAEYPNADYKINPSAIIITEAKGNPLDFELSENMRRSLDSLKENINNLDACITEAAEGKNFQPKILKSLNEHLSYIAAKLDGKTARQKQKTDADKIEEIKEAVEKLIKDDSDSQFKIDRKRAEQTLAMKADALGLQLEVVYVDDKEDEREKNANSAKTCVMRALWDGFISSDGTNHCSEAYKSVYTHPKNSKVYDIKDYDLDNSPIWQICAQVGEFKKFQASLIKGLRGINFPPDRLAELSYEDIAYTLCVQHALSPQEIARLHTKGKKPAFAAKISSHRELFYKNYIRKNEKAFRNLLKSQGKTEEYINDVVSALKKGHGHKDFDGHHIYNLSDPATYERATGKKWYTMDNAANIEMLDKNTHFVIHATENNINGGGRMIMENATSSHRTIFTDRNTGKKFYYIVRPKPGVSAILGMNNEIVFDGEYLMKNADKIIGRTDEKTEAATQTNEENIKHVRERLGVLKAKSDPAKVQTPDKTRESQQPPFSRYIGKSILANKVPNTARTTANQGGRSLFEIIQRKQDCRKG